MFPDKKTFVFTTDEPDMLQFNPDDLSTSGLVEFKDDMRNPTIGATHMVEDITTGDTLALLTEYPIGITGAQSFATFYRVTAENIAAKTRTRIGSIKTDTMSYYHAFGHTATQLVFPEFPVSFNMGGMVAGHPME